MHIAEVLSDLSSLRVCGPAEALALVHASSTTKESPLPSPNASATASKTADDPELNMVYDMLRLHELVKTGYTTGSDRSLDKARADVEQAMQLLASERLDHRHDLSQWLAENSRRHDAPAGAPQGHVYFNVQDSVMPEETFSVFKQRLGVCVETAHGRWKQMLPAVQQEYIAAMGVAWDGNLHQLTGALLDHFCTECSRKVLAEYQERGHLSAHSPAAAAAAPEAARPSPPPSTEPDHEQPMSFIAHWDRPARRFVSSLHAWGRGVQQQQQQRWSPYAMRRAGTRLGAETRFSRLLAVPE
ncbi:MAG: hypothetical protein M1826_004439 [Phylliscum demangeonii]|nr:MAG: hypothetical protein M1826_004439 [Phylliscum demangeonii]